MPIKNNLMISDILYANFKNKNFKSEQKNKLTWTPDENITDVFLITQMWEVKSII